MDRNDMTRWIAAYEQAWRTAGTEGLTHLFANDVSYLPSPWAEALSGLDELAPFWDAEREGADEPFDMASEVVAVDGDTAVVRLSVDYQATGECWRDLWVLRFGADGRCTSFEEWPFAPNQPDGH